MPADSTILPLAEKHLDALEALEAADGDVHWTRADFEKELYQEMGRFFVVVEEPGSESETLIGYGGYWKAGPEAQITNLVIRADRRCRGIARRLLEFLLDCARSEGSEVSTLEVRAANQHAQTLYERVGYTATGKRTAIYKNPSDDAILMEKKL